MWKWKIKSCNLWSTSCNRKLRQIKYNSLNTITYIDISLTKFGSIYMLSTVKKLSRTNFYVKQRKEKKNRFLEYLLWRPDVTTFQTKHVELIKIYWFIFPQSMVVSLSILRSHWDKEFVSGPEKDKLICSMKIKATISCASSKCTLLFISLNETKKNS